MARFDVDKLPPGKLVWDPDNPGIGYRRHKNGKGGTWFERHWVTLPDGTRKRVGPFRIDNCPNRLQAVGVLHKKKGEAFQNYYTEKRRVPTMREKLEDFLDAKRELETVDRYKQQLEDFILPAIGDEPMSSVTAAMCQKLYDKILDTEYAPATKDQPAKKYSKAYAGNILRCVQSFFQWARTAHIVTHDPVELVQLEDPENERERVLSKEEAPRADKAARAQHGYVRPLWFLLRLTGMRVGHALRLKWDDPVDLVEGLIKKTMPDKNARAVTIPMMLTLVDELRLWRRLSPNRTSPYVFPTRTRAGGRATHMSPASTRKAWEKLTAAAQLDDFTPHDLRRTFISRLSAIGATPKQVSKFTGHRAGGKGADRIVGRYEQPDLELMLELLERAFPEHVGDPSVIHPVRTSGTKSRSTTEQQVEENQDVVA